MTQQSSRQIYIGLDVEGILVLPKADFAWLKYDNLSSKEIRALFPRRRCEDYDTKYDDGRYLAELASLEGHSTGTWPCVSIALAALSGVDDWKLYKYALKTTQEMPGTEKFLEHAKEISDGRVYFFTSSYPAVALIIADKYGIPSSHVFTMGRQLTDDVLEEHDRRKLTALREVESRSPLNVFREHPTTLGIFMSEYFNVTEVIASFLEKKLGTIGEYHELLRMHDRLFELIPQEFQYLREELENCFLSPKSRGNMGSRNKTRAMRRTHDNGDDWVYVGDGIVDGHPIGFARYGVSMNMRDKHALPYSKVSVTTTKVSNLNPILDQALEGEFNVEELKQRLNSADTQVFSPQDISTHLDDVRKAAGDAKQKLNSLWIPV